jgi:hypothetical protein
MRNQILIAFIVCVFAAPTWAQETEFPYSAIVLKDGAQVHSGPGDSHYATHNLKENALVEVYRHDPGGWCAIRPPEKSFSLIPESAVETVGDGVAEVLEDGSQAWVGTILGPVEQPLWQVKLKKGERVAIVGEASWPHPSGKSVVWLQIEPPAGEYRWIQMSDLQLPPAKDDATKIDYSEPPSLGENSTPFDLRSVPSTNSTPSIAPKKNVPEFKPIAKAPSVSGWKAATRPIPEMEPEIPIYSGTFSRVGQSNVGQSEGQGFVEQATFQTEEPSDPRFESWDGRAIERDDSPERYASLDSMDRQVRSFVRERSAENLPAVVDSPVAPRLRNHAASHSSSVIEIERRLSNEVLKAPQSWSLADLKFDAERLRARSNDPVERLALQHVLDKIAKCDDLRKGYQQAGAGGSQFGNSFSFSPSSGTKYDASGWLKRLASSSGSIDPVYVLQDRLGNVTHEIVGMTGMNLGQYVDKRIGVLGRRGFNRRLDLKHVTADRVIVLR